MSWMIDALASANIRKAQRPVGSASRFAWAEVETAMVKALDAEVREDGAENTVFEGCEASETQQTRAPMVGAELQGNQS